MKRLFAALAASAAVLCFAADDKPSIESFFKLPQYAQMRLSPDGKHIAALAPFGARQGLIVLDVKDRKPVPVAAREDRDIVSVSWINNKRLLYRTGKLGEVVVQQRGGGLYAVDLDGSELRLISEGSDERVSGGNRVTFRTLDIVRTLPGETDDIIAEESVFNPGDRQEVSGPLYRVDTRTGRKVAISSGKPDSGPAESWVADRNGVARGYVVTTYDDTTRVYYRAGADAPWQKLDEFKQRTAAAWRPIAVAEDGRTLYVASRRGGDKSAIYRYDPETKTLGEVVAQHPQVDLEQLVADKEGVKGIGYDADRIGVAWLDDVLASAQAAADKALPGRINVLSWSADRSLVLIDSRSDLSPGSFYLYDRKAGKMEWLADRMPWIDPKAMSPMQPIRYKARDGLEIPAYLTIPRASSGKSLPLVVMVHGGPWVEGDTWGWQPEVQFLASRGYAVLQPNFRGTRRYGWKHYSASLKQWGLAMQDDITDGVNWAVAQGIADPRRVCIYGASYGGYATMMGLAKEPDLFKCGINYVGVTDLPLLLTASWSDTYYSDFARNTYKQGIGDVDADSERLKATSPSELASRIKAPVLMAYGGSDVRVVPQHGFRMKSALEGRGAKPEWILAVEEGHGFQDLKNKVMFYGAMEKFLDQYIGEKRN
jgi:dipeptidyl aminopeptidase/acylaminoacyl peptidase